MTKPRMIIIAACLACGALIWLNGCAKRTTRLPSTTPETSRQKQPIAPPDTSDTVSFREAQLTGELARQAKEALQSIYFDFDKYDLKPEATNRLAIVSRFLQNHPDLRILIAGNCDERGSSEYNIALGERRARTAKDYLVTLGIPSNRIEITSYGKERPAETGCTSEPCYGNNRRDDFTVLQSSRNLSSN
jgi:peptidoglycan-associated lipoprotein